MTDCWIDEARDDEAFPPRNTRKGQKAGLMKPSLMKRLWVACFFYHESHEFHEYGQDETWLDEAFLATDYTDFLDY